MATATAELEKSRPTEPLTARSGLQLAAAIRAGALSAREAVEAHIEVLQRVNPRINAVVCERFETAREEADAADQRVAEAEDPAALPPLLGVPCTVKEMIGMEGMPQCAGVVARRDHRCERTATIAQRLIDAGGI